MSTRALLYSCIIFLIFCAGCTNVVFAPTKRHVLTPNKIKLAYEDWYIPVQPQVKLHAWFLPAEKDPKGSVLFLHGNSQNISHHIASVFWLPRHGYNVLLYDYRGYGISSGFSTVDNAIADFPRVLQLLHEKDTHSRKRLIVFAQSLGGAIALNGLLYTPSHIKVHGVVVDSSFSSFRRIARQKLSEAWLTWLVQWPLSFTFTGKYASVKSIQHLSPMSVLVIHGTQDRVIPYSHGEALFKAAKEPKAFWPVEGGRHIDFVVKPDNRRRLLEYFSTVNVVQ